MVRVPRAVVAAVVLCTLAACGKKGPPLPPLHLVPDMVTEVTARRIGNQVRLRFVLPAKNLNGPDPVNLDKVEVYAATIAAGAVAPPNRDFLNAKHVVGTIAIKRVTPEAGAAPAAEDTRPAPGDAATFVEQLTEDKLRPQYTAMPPAAVAPTNATAAAAAADAAAAPTPPAAPLMRIYTIRGIARNGRPGQPTGRIQIPLTPLPSAPADVKVTFTEAAMTIAWTAPAAAADAPAPAGYNVYATDADVPLNSKPLTDLTFERPQVLFGKEECFVVRSALQFPGVSVESEPSAKQCVTPTDIFPPAQPKGLSAVAGAGSISLIWAANTEADIGGYLVLRGEAPGEKLQAITPAPINQTTYRDTTVKPGVRYVYAVVAVDRATPPNVSEQSARVEETAR